MPQQSYNAMLGTTTYNVRVGNDDARDFSFINPNDIEILEHIIDTFDTGSALPHSFVGDVTAITDPAMLTIATQGINIYDLSLMIKACGLYYDSSTKAQAMLQKISDFFSVPVNIQAVTTGSEWLYPTSPLPSGQGYYYSTITANGTAFSADLSQTPRSGENAWLLSAAYMIANATNTIPGSIKTVFSNVASTLNTATSALALINPANSYIRTNPDNADVTNHAQFMRSVMEHCISYASTLGSNGSNNSTQFNMLLGNILAGYVSNAQPWIATSANMNADGTVDSWWTQLSADVQYWLYLVFGIDAVETYMSDTAFSNRMLQNVWTMCGVTRNGVKSGISYTNGQSMISFEWTIGYIQTLKILNAKYPNQWISDAISQQEAYVTGYATNLDPIYKVLLPYCDSDVSVDTGFGWMTVPKMYSLASTLWNFFNKINYNAMDPNGGF